jgi:hypothetical protein
VFLAAGIGGCSEFPEQGFATHALGNPLADVLRYNMTTSTNIRGNEIARPEAAAATAAAPVHGTICERTAQERESDAAQQGYDPGVQQHVYEQTLSDCQAWSSLHTLH